MRVFPTLLSSRFENIFENISVFSVPILGPMLGPIFPSWGSNVITDMQLQIRMEVKKRQVLVVQMLHSRGSRWKIGQPKIGQPTVENRAAK